jgi:hypothetical protein
MTSRKHIALKNVSADKGLPEIPKLNVDLSEKLWTVKITFRKDKIKLGEDLTNNALQLIAGKGGKLYNVSKPFIDRVNKDVYVVIIKYMGKENYFSNENNKLL